MRFAPPIVAQTNAARVWGARVRPLAVGLVPWNERAERTTVVVKATYDVGDGLTLSEQQRPFGRGEASTRRGALSMELACPDDLVLGKLGADVLLTGSAYADRALPLLDAAVRIPGKLELAFAVVGPSATECMPLAGEYLRAADGVSPMPPVGAVRARPVYAESADAELDDLSPQERQAVLDEVLARCKAQAPPRVERVPVRVAEPLVLDQRAWGDLLSQFGEGAYDSWSDLARTAPQLDEGVQYAAAHLVTAFLECGDVFEMHNLRPGGGSRSFALPEHVPLVVAEGRHGRFNVEMMCDTLVLDCDAATLTLTWRGQVPEDLFASPISSLIVTFAERARTPELETIYGELSRAHYARAEVPDSAAVPRVAGRDVALDLARAKNFHRTPLPVLEQHVAERLRADLAERPPERVELLAAHGMDEDEWGLEVRAWDAVIERAGAGAHRTVRNA